MTLRFEHYELLQTEDGRPVELGRGAIGITYKAFDVDLHCPVTLKVISEKYLGEESARLRFLREARAAASVRHPNVASVFHLGRTGQNYFYAMEFVEGETLKHLIKRSARLDVSLALEIAMQVAAGLAAIHEQHLVHRDIKPTNIMVRLKEERSVTAKIIDLGLAKTLDGSASEAGISSPGAFAGTPEFASPEQFAGVGVDREHSDSVALRIRDALDHAAREWKIQRCHFLEEKERQLRGSGRLDDADLARQERLELPKARLALVVDQLQELFTTGRTPGMMACCGGRTIAN